MPSSGQQTWEYCYLLRVWETAADVLGNKWLLCDVPDVFFFVKPVLKFSDLVIICSHYYFLWLATLARVTNCFFFRNVFFN